MIKVKEKNFFSAFKKAYFNLYQSKDSKDINLWKEKSGIIFLDKPNIIPPLKIKNNHLRCCLDYKKYFPYISEDIIEKEFDYWSTELLTHSRVKSIITYLKKYPSAKRAIINSWKNKYRDLRFPSSCVVYLFFRNNGEFLELHTHMRANNVYFLLFIDMSILLGIYRWVAQELSLKLGSYIHFVDLLVFFNKEKKSIIKQYKFMKNSNLWKNV